MDSRLESAIQEFGGKHGVLQLLREEPDGKQFIPPSEILHPGEAFTYATWRKVMAACRDEGANRVILRTSQAADWQGMVDTMPTVVVGGGWTYPYFAAKAAIDRLRLTCLDPRLIEYSTQEGTGYDPTGVTISLTPYLGAESYTVTEHPNQEGVVLVDYSVRDGVEPGHDSHRRADNPQMDDLRSGVLELRAWLRSLDLFPEDVALQIEQGWGGKSVKLFQVKDFAAVQRADFSLSENTPGILDQGVAQRRNFGVTGPEGLLVYRSSAREHRGGMKDIPAPHGPIAFWLNENTGPLTLEDYNPNILAYVAAYHSNIALSHANTRFVQAALRKGGVARLTNGAGFGYQPDRGENGATRIISDGYRWAVTAG